MCLASFRLMGVRFFSIALIIVSDLPTNFAKPAWVDAERQVGSC